MAYHELNFNLFLKHELKLTKRLLSNKIKRSFPKHKFTSNVICQNYIKMHALVAFHYANVILFTYILCYFFLTAANMYKI